MQNNYIHNRFASVVWRAQTFGKLHSVPHATEPPYSAILAKKGGDLSSKNVIKGEGSLVGPGVSLGQGCSADLTGQGEILSASLSMIIQMVSNLVGGGSISSASMVGSLSLASDLIGSGNLTAALALIVWMASDLDGTGVIGGSNLTGLGHMSSDITSQGEVVTAQSCAAAVWSALASLYDVEGTMGKKMNSAASAGDPWGTELPGDYPEGSAGALLFDLIRLTGHKVVREDDLITIYQADGITVWRQYNLADGGRVEV